MIFAEAIICCASLWLAPAAGRYLDSGVHCATIDQSAKQPALMAVSSPESLKSDSRSWVQTPLKSLATLLNSSEDEGKPDYQVVAQILAFRPISTEYPHT